MERKYTGDIEGQFWVNQSSDDPAEFGAHEDRDFIYYFVDDNEACRDRLEELFADLGITENFVLTEGEVKALADRDDNQSHERRGLYASLALGLKIYQCVERQGHCYFEAEC
jgi:hypothetical protein